MSKQYMLCDKAGDCGFTACLHHSPHGLLLGHCAGNRCDMRTDEATCVPMVRKSAFLTELTDLLNAGYTVHFAPLPSGGGDIVVIISRSGDEIARRVGYVAIVSEMLGEVYEEVNDADSN